jgi:hypothetical protein
LMSNMTSGMRIAITQDDRGVGWLLRRHAATPPLVSASAARSVSSIPPHTPQRSPFASAVSAQGEADRTVAADLLTCRRCCAAGVDFDPADASVRDSARCVSVPARRAPRVHAAGQGDPPSR